MKKTLYLMRHGETLFNSLGKIQGACDSPLTEKGIKQAKIAGRYFRENNIIFDHVYSSTQERAVDTLEIVTENKLSYTRLKGIKEMNLGLFEGESTQLQPSSPEYYESFYASFGGEKASQVSKRMVETLTAVMNKESHSTVLAVSHGGASMLFLREVKGETEKTVIPFQNCSIAKCTFENGRFTFDEIINHDFSMLD